MYKKTIKRGENSYTYYYTNICREGKVKNIFLSSDEKKKIGSTEPVNFTSQTVNNVFRHINKTNYGIILRYGYIQYGYDPIASFINIKNLGLFRIFPSDPKGSLDAFISIILKNSGGFRWKRL
jgi:hypothetical protein